MKYISPDHHRDELVKRFHEEYREKYDAGQAEHGGNLWEKANMVNRAKEEILDQWSYVCALEDQIREAVFLLRDIHDKESVIAARNLLVFGRPTVPEPDQE
jgi:hypothetical protein